MRTLPAQLVEAQVVGLMKMPVGFMSMCRDGGKSISAGDLPASM
jgi:hypothetical protein